MSRPSIIRCSNCGEPTGAWFIGGDPYLPGIECSDCVIEDPDPPPPLEGHDDHT
jgi:hypothetical protein